MNERRRIEERLRKKELEIQELENRLRDAKTYIQALQDVLKILPKDSASSEAVTILRPGSSVAKSQHAIRDAGKPLHISEILIRIGKEDTRANRAAIGGSISAYVRRNEIFVRTAPNTFGLIELGHEGGMFEAAEPPADFGDNDLNSLDDSSPDETLE